MIIEGQFQFWSNELESPNDPPHVHVVDTEALTEGRIGLVTGYWIDAAPRTSGDAALQAFRKRRLDCLAAWHSNGRRSALGSGARARSGYEGPPSTPLNSRPSQGGPDHKSAEAAACLETELSLAATTPERLDILARRDPPLGACITFEKYNIFLPLDWLRFLHDPDHRARMTEIRETGAAVVGVLVRRGRLAQHLSQDGLAWRAGLNVRQVATIETGKADFDLDALEHIARELRLPVQHLLMDRYVVDGA